GGDGGGTRLFEEPFASGDTVRTVLRRFSRRFPELDDALWNPTRTELGESIEVVVNDAGRAFPHHLASPLEGGERIPRPAQFRGGRWGGEAMTANVLPPYRI